MKQGWDIKKIKILKDLCENFKSDIVDGPFGSNMKRSDYKEDGIPVLKIQNVKPFRIEIKKMDFVTELKYAELKRHSYKKGDIVMTKLGAPLGASAIVENIEDGLIVADLVRIRAQKINTKYLCYHLNSPNTNNFINTQQKGTTRPRIRISVVRDLPIYAPPLSEQQRIVAILDKAFTAIVKAKANAEQNLKNAKELFKSYLQGVFENKDKRWEEIKLSDLATDITDGDHMPPPKTESGIPFITISNINKENYEINFSNTFSVPIEYFQKIKGNRKPKKGDILYTVTGSYGIPVLIESNIEFCFQRHIGLIRPKENVNSKWLFYWILSPHALKQANETATGTAQKTVSLKALRNFILPNFSIKEQQSIVKKLDVLAAETKKLEAVYQKKIEDLDELKKSVLQKAFNGEL